MLPDASPRSPDRAPATPPPRSPPTPAAPPVLPPNFCSSFGARLRRHRSCHTCAGGDVQRGRHSGGRLGGSSVSRPGLPCDPAIPTPGTRPKRLETHVHTQPGTLMSVQRYLQYSKDRDDLKAQMASGWTRGGPLTGRNITQPGKGTEPGTRCDVDAVEDVLPRECDQTKGDTASGPIERRRAQSGGGRGPGELPMG